MATQASLVSATTAQIAAARALVIAYLADQYPALAISAGQLSDLVVLPAADALTAVTVYAEDIEASSNPETALADGGYDADILNAVLAGRGVTRIAAAAASGTVAIYLNSYVAVTIPSGYQMYTADGTYYATSNAARVLAPGSNAVSATDVVAVTVPEGGYAIVVAAAAVNTGAAGNRSAGTSLTAASPISQQTAIYIASDMTGGADAETDAALLARLPTATAPRSVASMFGAAAVVTDAYPYGSVQVIGFGNPGMLRGRSALVGQSPGRVDVNVSTSTSPSLVRVPVTATLISKTPFGLWMFTLETNQAPGRFLVQEILPSNDPFSVTGFQPATTSMGFDISEAGAPIDIRLSQDAAFSAYSTLTVTFYDSTTPTTGLTVNVSTMSYDCIARTIADLDVSQAAVEVESVRSAGGDCLVRAACPVMVTLTAVATVSSGSTLTPAQVSLAVANAICATGISQIISASSVSASAAANLPTGTALQLTNWTGIIYGTDGSVTTVTGASGLTVPTVLASGIGPGTTAFYADPTGITSSVVTAS